MPWGRPPPPPSVPADAARLVLVGMTGSGKTTAGRLLAERLGCRHLDADELVADAAGMSVAALWTAQGEAAFRVAERRAIERALERPGPQVLSVGGGAVTDERTRRALRRDGTVVWLRARDATLVDRLGRAAAAEDRPVLQGDPTGRVPLLSAQRRRWYAEVADVVVDVDDLSPEAVADRIVAALDASGPAPSGQVPSGPAPTDPAPSGAHGGDADPPAGEVAR